MNAQEMFISVMIILLIFNIYYTFTFTEAVWSLTIGALTGFIAVILAVGIISGVQVLGSGLTGESIKIMFGCGALLNILFQINIFGFPLGMGLVTNVLSVFGSEFLALGIIITSVLGMIAFVSGLIIITGGSTGG